MTMMLRSETDFESVLRIPSTRDMITMNTVTTSPITNTVMPVETLRTIRFRRLYFRGIATLRDLPKAVDDLDSRRANGRNDARKDSDRHRNEECEHECRSGDAEIVREGCDRRVLQDRDHPVDERNRKAHPEGTADQRE